jgi:LysR family transcriptional regulator, glycine cleavage system transcriptional activator
LQWQRTKSSPTLKNLFIDMARYLHQLKALQAFEASARCGSFVLAAKELNVTSAAVGQLVRSLEGTLGTSLFQRLEYGSNRLILTERGRLAFPALSEGLDRMAQALADLRSSSAQPSITVSVSQSFAARWLMPRIEKFTSEYPSVDIRLDITDRLVNIERGDADIAIRCGAGSWPGVSAHKLRSEEVFPVAAPSIVQRSRRLETKPDISSLTLIHDASLPRESVFPSWKAWLEKAELDSAIAKKGIHINSSASAIQAAVNGQGVALVRALLAHDDLKAKRLVRLYPKIHWPIRWSYYVLHRSDLQGNTPAADFVSWLRTEFMARR